MINDKKALKNLKNIQKQRINSKYYNIHPNWQNYFKQQKRFNIYSINNFLDQRKKIAFGIGITRNNYADEYESFKFLYNIQNSSNPNFNLYLNKIECEKIFGEIPIKYKKHNLTRSNLMNAETAFYLNESLSGLLSKREINILEIGSGYGELCRQLIKYSKLDISKYHLVDLPKNLLFAEKYLTKIFNNSHNLETRISNFYNQKNKLSSILFHLPHEIESLEKYDLIINTYSFQEMDKETTLSYFKYISNHLKSNGYFFSINSPRKWDIKTYSDFNNLKNLQNIVSIMHRQIPPSIGGTVPIVNLFKKNEITYSKDDLDLITELQTKGFSNLLNGAYRNFNLSNFSCSEFFQLVGKYNLKSIEKKEVNKLTENEILAYLYFLLIENINYDEKYAFSFLKYYLNQRNKTISLKLLYEFSILTNNKLTRSQINEFFNNN